MGIGRDDLERAAIGFVAEAFTLRDDVNRQLDLIASLDLGGDSGVKQRFDGALSDLKDYVRVLVGKDDSTGVYNHVAGGMNHMVVNLNDAEALIIDSLPKVDDGPASFA
ncbi:hypothetical protein [Actinoallomurus purpureus]|uniref:hypothetical protein n=1 Tax=Actinoallomurus purpureus TaxID=478114 RepID=UPI0020921025|nr:hypothetical protein [Actinoallomurus purpureus]